MTVDFARACSGAGEEPQILVWVSTHGVVHVAIVLEPSATGVGKWLCHCDYRNQFTWQGVQEWEGGCARLITNFGL